MKIKRIILIVFLVMLAGIITFCATWPQRVLNSAYRAIPEGIQFYEDNEEFFDLLLDIQNRIVAFDAENEDKIKKLSFDIYFGNEFRISEPDGYLYPGSRFDILTQDEWQLIDTTLRKRERNGEKFISAEVSESHVVVHGFFGEHSEDAEIFLMSPKEVAIWKASISRWKEYVEPFNDDWSIVIMTKFQN